MSFTVNRFNSSFAFLINFKTNDQVSMLIPSNCNVICDQRKKETGNVLVIFGIICVCFVEKDKLGLPVRFVHVKYFQSTL